MEVIPRFCVLDNGTARCGVEKDAGDDPDITDGCLIVAEVRRTTAATVNSGNIIDRHTDADRNVYAKMDRTIYTEMGRNIYTKTDNAIHMDADIIIDGGAGVGRVTKPGLDQPVGAAAINRVPRQMIAQAVKNVCNASGYAGGLSVMISVPDGERLAQKTFNPNLGIAGGISILGTSGIVEPMSERAFVDALALEIHQATTGKRCLILTPGNYGLDFVNRSGWDKFGVPVVRFSNYIGDALDIAATENVSSVLIAGHAGKLVKLAGGIMNTHSRMADCRNEIFCAYAAVSGADTTLCRALMNAVSTDACLELLDAAGLRQTVTQHILNAVQHHLERRVQYRAGAVMFSNVYGLLGQTSTAKQILAEWSGNQPFRTGE